MFQLSLFTEFGRLCNPFDYVLGFTFLLMAFHLLFLAGPAAAYCGAAALVPVHQSHL